MPLCDEFVCVPADGPSTPAFVLDLARAAVRDGVAETLAVTYGTFYYEMEQVPSPVDYPPFNLWAIIRWPVGDPPVLSRWTKLRRNSGGLARAAAEQAHGTDQAESSEQAHGTDR